MNSSPVFDAHMHIGELSPSGASSTVAELEEWMEA